MAKTPEDPAAAAELDAELKRVQLETAQLQLDEQREKNHTLKAQKAEKSRQNQARQTQLRSEVETRASITRKCRHRQGGTPKNPYNGKGPTALNIATMPDGFTKLIMCGICRLRIFTPHPRDASKKPKGNETAAEAKNRVERYNEDLERYNELLEMAKDNLTEEGAQEMDCGTTIVLRDEDGREVLPIRPCDTYATAQR